MLELLGPGKETRRLEVDVYSRYILHIEFEGRQDYRMLFYLEREGGEGGERETERGGRKLGTWCLVLQWEA